MRLFLAAALIAAADAAPAHSSQLVDRNASNVKLAVNAKGEALLTYEAEGATKHVLAWGAVNAIAPTGARQQVEFSLDYSGGYGKYHRDYWKTFGGDCGEYDGPPLAWLVAACKAPDGSYWALQAWQRSLPDYGIPATASQSVWELHLSHWTGPLAVLTIKEDWSYRRFDHLYGSLTYGGGGVYGFRSTRTGSPARHVRAQRLRRHIRVRPTARAGNARTASSRTGRTDRSVTASIRTEAIRSARERSTAPP